MVVESYNPFFVYFLGPAQPTLPGSHCALFRCLPSRPPASYLPATPLVVGGSCLLRLRQSVAYWELEFRRILHASFRCPCTDYKSLGALRDRAGGEGEKGGRREEEEGAGGRRCGGRGPGPGVREAVVEGGGGSGLESQPRQGGHFGGARQ